MGLCVGVFGFMGVEKRFVDCRRGKLRGGAARKRVVYVCRCGREFVLNAVKRRRFIGGEKQYFNCGCVKIVG